MGATHWPPPSYDPQTELFYLNGTEGYGIAYLYDPPDNPEGYGGGGGSNFDTNSALFRSRYTDRKNQMEARAYRIRRRLRRHHNHGGKTSVHRRFGAASRIRSGKWQDFMASAPDVGGQQRSCDVDAGRQAVHRRGRATCFMRSHWLGSRWPAVAYDDRIHRRFPTLVEPLRNFGMIREQRPQTKPHLRRRHRLLRVSSR
jgi:hypothetical protein